MSEAVLYHYGVKGMKWGVRRSQAQLDAAAKRRGSRRETRSETRSNLVDRSTPTNIAATGAATAAGMLLGPVGALQTASIGVGYNISRAGGMGRGASAATALLGGAPGSILVNEIRGASKARRENQ